MRLPACASEELKYAEGSRILEDSTVRGIGRWMKTLAEKESAGRGFAETPCMLHLTTILSYIQVLVAAENRVRTRPETVTTSSLLSYPAAEEWKAR